MIGIVVLDCRAIDYCHLRSCLDFVQQVKPVLSRLKTTLVFLAASILSCVLLLVSLDGGQIEEAGNRVIPGVYNDDSARSFEPDAFCGEPGLP